MTCRRASLPDGIERTLAWLSKCRAILVHWDKKAANFAKATTDHDRPVLVMARAR